MYPPKNDSYYIYPHNKYLKKNNNMKTLSTLILSLGIATLCSCGQTTSPSTEQTTAQDSTNQVVETIMARRSIRQYKPQPVEREKMEQILECGINAPNGMHKESWQIRVIDNPDIINGITELYLKENPNASKKPGFKNIFNNAPTVVFIAYDTTYDLSQVDCGLLGENIILTAQSMGIGSCCLGAPIRFMNSEAASDYLKKLELPDTHKLLYAIALGYPDESPAAKSRDKSKIKFID